MTAAVCNEMTNLSNSFDPGNIIEEANDFLIFRKFQQCIDACNKGLAYVKQYPENLRQTIRLRPPVVTQRAVETAESLCIVAIQAFAELNRWQEVLPFITHLYSGIEDCPPRIVQLCVLLHAHVKEYPTCTAITHIWLKNPHNFSNRKYHELCSVYITKVLVPLNKWDDIEHFLESSPGLNIEQKSSFLKQVQKLKQQKEQECSDEIEELEDEEKKDGEQRTDRLSDQEEFTQDQTASWGLMEYMKKINTWIKLNVPKSALQFAKNITVFALVIYILVTRPNFDMLSRKKLWALWGAIMHMWKRMFSPFHLSSR